MIRVLLHSPENDFAAFLASALRPEFAVTCERDKHRLQQVAASGQYAVLVLDFDSNRSSLSEQLAFTDSARRWAVPVVVITDLARCSADFVQHGAYDCLRKSPPMAELRVVLRRAGQHGLMRLEQERARRTLRSGYGCDRLVGSSEKSRCVYDLIRRVANLNVPVLITGESGTGKELVANAIHNLGNRAQHPFLAVSCCAIPETLIEAELFGHEKGAFTGSSGARAGLLEQAGEGTIFLDEIGELSLNTQVKLLRVLQQREFSRLGGSRLIPLNARVLFATHRPLAQMVQAGTFRKDLYFRVKVISVNIPPLRERAGDIPQLARYFLHKYAAEYGKPLRTIRPDAIALLMEYDWPGNIRELENVIQSAMILTDGDAIRGSDLPLEVQELARSEDGVEESHNEPVCFDDLLRQYKVKLAAKTITECNGNKSLAARKLKVSRAYLHRLIRMGGAAESPDAA